jgi:hypothetical protein
MEHRRREEAAYTRELMEDTVARPNCTETIVVAPCVREGRNRTKKGWNYHWEEGPPPAKLSLAIGPHCAAAGSKPRQLYPEEPQTRAQGRWIRHKEVQIRRLKVRGASPAMRVGGQPRREKAEENGVMGWCEQHWLQGVAGPCRRSADCRWQRRPLE